MNPKELGITSTSELKAKVSDVRTYGNSDAFQLLCKASSEAQGWMKSTKVCNVYGGCVMQVTTQQRNPDGSYSVADSIAYVPDVHIDTSSKPPLLIAIPHQYLNDAFSHFGQRPSEMKGGTAK